MGTVMSVSLGTSEFTGYCPPECSAPIYCTFIPGCPGGGVVERIGIETGLVLTTGHSIQKEKIIWIVGGYNKAKEGLIDLIIT